MICTITYYIFTIYLFIYLFIFGFYDNGVGAGVLSSWLIFLRLLGDRLILSRDDTTLASSLAHCDKKQLHFLSQYTVPYIPRRFFLTRSNIWRFMVQVKLFPSLKTFP